MADVSVWGLPALVIEVGVMVVAAIPVWIGAKVVGAGKATLLRAIVAMLVGTVAAVIAGFVGAAMGGFVGLLLALFAYLFSLKIILDTSMFGALALSVVAAVIYACVSHLLGGGVSTSP